MKRRAAVLFQYIIVVTHDLIEEGALPYYYKLASGLVNQHTRVALFFTQGGVYTTQKQHAEALRYFSEAHVELWVDEQSTRRRKLSVRYLKRSSMLSSLSSVPLAPRTFVLVDPLAKENHNTRRALSLALRRGLEVSFFSLDGVKSLSITRPKRLLEPADVKTSDWISLLIDRVAREELILTWVDCCGAASPEMQEPE